MADVEFVDAHVMTRVSGEADIHTVDNGTMTSNQPAQETTDDGISDPNSPPETDYPTGTRLWLIMLTISSVLTLTSLDMNIIATAVPSITSHFHTVADIGWYSSAFRLNACAFQFVFGKAYSLYPVKRVFLLSNAISMVGSLLCGVAATSGMLIAGRAVAGLGSAGLVSGCFVVLVQSVPVRRRPVFSGVMAGVEGVATMGAPLIGGALTESLGWRWCFYINPPIGVVTLLLTVFCFTDIQKPSTIAHMSSRQKLSQLDLVSNLILLPALTSLFLAFSWAGTKYPWNSGKVIGPLVNFAILLAAFIYNQIRRGDTAALPPRVIKRRSVIAGIIFITCANSTGNVLEYYLPTYYQVVRGYTPAKSGYMMLPIIIGATIGSLVHGAGTSAFGYFAPFMFFASIIMPIAAGLITTLRVDTSFVQLILYTAFSGLGYGLGFSGPQNAVQTVLPAEDISIGLSVMLFAQSFGPAVAIAIAQVLFTNQLSTNLKGLVPKLNGTSIANNGLAEILNSVPLTESGEVLKGIDESLAKTWYLVVGLACATMIGSVSIEWRSVKQKRL